MTKPVSRGRQKIAMKKIQDKTHLGVTFTKRRNGLFKKANELVSLCGTELAILLFSPGHKAYSFGHPTVYSAFDRFLGRDVRCRDPRRRSQVSAGNRGASHVPTMGVRGGRSDQEATAMNNSAQKARIDALNAELKDLEKRVEHEKKIAKELKERGMHEITLDMIPRDQLTPSQKIILRDMLKQLHMRICAEIRNRIANNNNPNPEDSVHARATVDADVDAAVAVAGGENNGDVPNNRAVFSNFMPPFADLNNHPSTSTSIDNADNNNNGSSNNHNNNNNNNMSLGPNYGSWDF